MSLAASNASVKAFLLDDDFREDKNPHKYIILWSSKFYRLINKVMRNHDISEILQRTKYIRRYITKMVKYFFKYGLYKDDLIKRSQKLYRGIDKDFEIPLEYKESGFMSTTQSLSVAKSFAGKNGGNIIVFATNKLPTDTPFVRIDESIDEYLAEKEILFLPGTIKLKKSSNYIKAVYEMNPLFRELHNDNAPLQGGGLTIKDTDLIDLKGKYIVWWRAIKGRPVEVVSTMQMPRKSAEVARFFKEAVLPHDDKFEVKTNFIPEYMDLKKKMLTNYKAVRKDERELYKSYMVHMGIYNAKTKEVLTIHYGVFDEMFNEELFNPQRTKEVHEAILKHCSWF
jgi:hypothetical protein